MGKHNYKFRNKSVNFSFDLTVQYVHEHSVRMANGSYNVYHELCVYLANIAAVSEFAQNFVAKRIPCEGFKSQVEECLKLFENQLVPKELVRFAELLEVVEQTGLRLLLSNATVHRNVDGSVYFCRLSSHTSVVHVVDNLQGIDVEFVAVGANPVECFFNVRDKVATILGRKVYLRTPSVLARMRKELPGR